MDFSAKINALKDNAPNVLNFVFKNEKMVLQEVTETQEEVLQSHENQKQNMAYNGVMEKRQRQVMARVRMKFMK